MLGFLVDGMQNLKLAERNKISMKSSFLDFLNKSWKVAHLDFEYPSHIRRRIICIHLIFLFLFLGLMKFCTLCGIGALLTLWSWNYFTLWKKGPKIYEKNYQLKKYEIFGTIYASILISLLIFIIIFYKLLLFAKIN